MEVRERRFSLFSIDFPCMFWENTIKKWRKYRAVQSKNGHVLPEMHSQRQGRKNLV